MEKGPAALLTLVLAAAPLARGEPVAVRYQEGSLHGFLALRTLEGQTLAAGDLYQSVRSGRVTAKLVFRFRDGSVSEETAVFTQKKTFRLVSNHLVQKGPAFKQPMDLFVDALTGDVTVKTMDDGKEKVITEKMELPPDLANGIVSTVMKNVPDKVPKITLSLVVATPKPRVVKLEIARAGKDTFTLAGARRKATRYTIDVEIGGLAGVIAPLIGKDPPQSRLWILGGEAPAFVRSEAPLALGGDVLRVDLIGPSWPRPAGPPRERATPPGKATPPAAKESGVR